METAGGFKVDVDLATIFLSTSAGFCVGIGGASCNKLADADSGAGFNFHHDDMDSRKDSRTAEFSVSVTNTLTTSGEPGLAGAGGDLFLSASVAVQFIETARIFVPDNVCSARRFDYETWILLGADETDADTPGYTEGVLFAAESGSKVDASLGSLSE